MAWGRLHAWQWWAAGAAVLLAGCAGTPAVEPSREPQAVAAERLTSPGEVVAELAMGMLGVPYRYGGSHPEQGFDCSGLVHYTYAQAGHPVARSSLELFRAARKIAPHEAAAGDLMFFQDEEKLAHVGIYLGDGLFVHAPASGRTVSVASIAEPYYRSHLVGVGRLLPD